MTHLPRAIAALLLLLFLSACGQSGPLYIPGDPSVIEPQPQQPQQNEEEDEDDSDDPGMP